MHQIRVHLAYLGHPIVGDKIYGGNEQNYLDFIESGWTPQLASRLYIERHALHASALTFPYGESSISVNSPMPDDMRLLLEGE